MATEDQQQVQKCTLKRGEPVTIGCSPLCEVVIQSRFLSGKHCEVAMTTDPAAAGGAGSGGDKHRQARYTVCDTSSNGTWLLRKTGNRPDEGTHSVAGVLNSANAMKRAKKLVKGRREELNPGDCILLLSPLHHQCLKFVFVLMKSEGDRPCALQRLSCDQGVSIEENEKIESPEIVSVVPASKRTRKSGIDKYSNAETDKIIESPEIVSVVPASKRTRDSSIDECSSSMGVLKRARIAPVESYLDEQPCTSREALRAYDKAKKKRRVFDAEEPIDVDSIPTPRPPALLSNESQDECPMCRRLFPISVLPVHCDACMDSGDDVIIVGDNDRGETDGKRPLRKPYLAKTLSTTGRGVNVNENPAALHPNKAGPGGDIDDVVELEQCIYCLKDFPVSELVAHVSTCACHTDEVMERCPHCSNMYPLSEFYMHLLKEQKLMKERAVANYEALMVASEARLITNTEEFECMICYVGVEPGEGVILKGCLHQFCKECLRQHVKLGEDAEVKCPHQDEHYTCSAVISEREIREIVSAEELQQLHRRGLRLAENASGNSFHCRTANCEGFCFLEDEANEFQCPVCEKVNCVLCKAIHEGLDCRQYQDELAWNEEGDKESKATRKMLQNLVVKGKAMHCPKCRIIVQKREGCDWISCAMCKTEICWATKGPRWGPKGRGDVSGGCQCNYNGKRCHPKCGNCH